jgi:hypothetical protein
MTVFGQKHFASQATRATMTVERCSVSHERERSHNKRMTVPGTVIEAGREGRKK